MMLRLRSLVFDILMYAAMILMGIAFAPLALWSRAGAYWAIKTYSRSVFWLLRVICGLRVEVRGTVPEGEVLVASKHQSFLDILIHTAHLPRPRFIMKAELKWAPVLGLYAMRIGSTPVVRGKKAASVKGMVSSAQRQAPAKGQLVIYPQGTRVLPGSTLPYRVGAGVLYERMGIPCVPAATNVGVFWARRSPLKRPGLAVVEYLETIPAGLPMKDFMARLEAEIETASDALMREAGYDPAKGIPFASGRERF